MAYVDLAAAIMRELGKAELRTLQYGQDLAIQLSQGPFKLRQLRKMGHPYSTKDPRPPLPTAIVNEQTGEYKDSWEVEMFYGFGDTFGELRNTSPNAHFLEGGTERMIAHSPFEILEKKMEPVRQRNIQQALERAFKELE